MGQTHAQAKGQGYCAAFTGEPNQKELFDLSSTLSQWNSQQTSSNNDNKIKIEVCFHPQTIETPLKSFLVA